MVARHELRHPLTATTQIAIREAKRQNAGYRQHSVKALARIAMARIDTDLSDAVYDVVQPILAQGTDADADAMEIDGQEDARKAEDM